MELKLPQEFLTADGMASRPQVLSGFVHEVLALVIVTALAIDVYRFHVFSRSIFFFFVDYE